MIHSSAHVCAIIDLRSVLLAVNSVAILDPLRSVQFTSVQSLRAGSMPRRPALLVVRPRVCSPQGVHGYVRAGMLANCTDDSVCTDP